MSGAGRNPRHCFIFSAFDVAEWCQFRANSNPVHQRLLAARQGITRLQVAVMLDRALLVTWGAPRGRGPFFCFLSGRNCQSHAENLRRVVG